MRWLSSSQEGKEILLKVFQLQLLHLVLKWDDVFDDVRCWECEVGF